MFGLFINKLEIFILFKGLRVIYEDGVIYILYSEEFSSVLTFPKLRILVYYAQMLFSQRSKKQASADVIYSFP